MTARRHLAASILALLAVVALIAWLGGRSAAWADEACTANPADACHNGGGWRVPDFFTGYAVQSAGIGYPAGTGWGRRFNASTSHQPADRRYRARPPWPVAGVDYGVGLPRAMMPTPAMLHPAWLKDPAAIATDPLVNPARRGENCRFYLSNDAVPGGVAAGGLQNPAPFSWTGPGIYCAAGKGSTEPMVFEGYDFGWNSRTGFGCVPVVIASRAWGTRTRARGPGDAAIRFSRNLFVNGPGCNLAGGVGAGPGSASLEGPLGFAAFVNLLGARPNSLAFVNNTVLGCGGDAGAGALERALCTANWPAGARHRAGPIVVAGYGAGVAPMNAHVIYDGQAGSNSWIAFNAFIHLTGRVVDYAWSNVAASSHRFDHNYIEGMNYQDQPYVEFEAIRCTDNCAAPSPAQPARAEITLAPGSAWSLPTGSSYTVTLAANGAAGMNWSGTYTVMASDPAHLVLQSTVNPGDWRWASGPHPAALARFAHGEVQYIGGAASAAQFIGTIRGTVLTVADPDGPLGPGRYVTAAGAIDARFAGSVTGRTLRVARVDGGTIAVGQALEGPGIAEGTTLVGGAGIQWTLNQPAAVADAALATRDVVPYGTRIVAGSGTTWTLDRDAGSIGPIAMTSPYHTVGAAEGGITAHTISYNTVLMPAGAWGWGTSTFFYTGVSTDSVPYQVLTGSIDHNVIVTNLFAGASHRQQSVAAVETDFTRLNDVSIAQNWIDPTGSPFCWASYGLFESRGVTMAGNVNLLASDDPYINRFDVMPVIPFDPGTGAGHQPTRGIDYDPQTGLVTVRLAFAAPWLRAGTRIRINGDVSQGANFARGTFAVRSVDGPVLTYDSGLRGAPGLFVGTGSHATVAALADDGNPQQCRGHN